MFYTHFPEDRNCEICQRTKITRAPCRRRILAESYTVPKILVILITADHKVLSEGCESRNNHRYAVVVQDLATQWIQSYPCKTQTSQETQRSLQKLLEPDRKPKVIHTDNSLEFAKGCEDLSWNHCTSTPHRSETNGIAERAVRTVSIVAIRSGWKLVGRFHGMLYLSAKCYRSLIWWENPVWETFGEPCKGPIIPFGSLVEYYPVSAKDQSRIHQFGKKVLPGLFLGYALYAGWIWKGDIMVADVEELETMDASEIYSKRLNAKEVIFPKENGNIFPVAYGRIKLSGGDQELRTSTLVRPRPIQGESHVDFLGESEASLPPPQDSLPDAGEAINDIWSMSGNFIYRHHVEPRVKTLLAETRIIPYSTGIHQCLQNYTYKLGWYARKPHRRLWEYRWIKRFVWFLDRFHSVYSIGRKNSRRIFVVRGETDKTAGNIQARPFMARALDVNGKACQAEGEAEVV